MGGDHPGHIIGVMPPCVCDDALRQGRWGRFRI